MSETQYIIKKNGRTSYFKDKECTIYHRDEKDGPAIIWARGDKYWMTDGHPHRLSGPAVEYASGLKQYWINGVYFSEKDFNEKMNPKVQIDPKLIKVGDTVKFHIKNSHIRPNGIGSGTISYKGYVCADVELTCDMGDRKVGSSVCIDYVEMIEHQLKQQPVKSQSSPKKEKLVWTTEELTDDCKVNPIGFYKTNEFERDERFVYRDRNGTLTYFHINGLVEPFKKDCWTGCKWEFQPNLKIGEFLK